jgi:hypothetical protein
MVRFETVYAAQTPAGVSVGRIVAGALMLLGLNALLPAPWGLHGLRLLAGAAALGALAAQRYASRAVLGPKALSLLGPLGGRVVPLGRVTGLCVGRRGVLSADPLSALLSGEALLPAHWSGVQLRLRGAPPLFVPAADPHELARRLRGLCPEARWDDLSENDYFLFLAQRRPSTWPRSTRSSIPTASARPSGSTTSLSVRRPA